MQRAEAWKAEVNVRREGVDSPERVTRVEACQADACPTQTAQAAPDRIAYQGSSIRPTICWAIFTIASCWVETTERPNSGTSIAA